MTVISDVAERRAWQALGGSIPRPKAILVISAHWETQGYSAVTAEENPVTIHDFRGFSQELHEMQYPAAGSPPLAARVIEMLGPVQARGETGWGFDHGAWGVAQPMYPAADIPMIELSLDRALPPHRHLELGARLAPLRDEGVLIVASGNIIHNLALWRQTEGTVPGWAEDFRQRSNAAILSDDHDALVHFAPEDEAAALAINSGEHYLPLLYAVGARLPGDDAVIFNDTIDGSLSMTSVLIGDAGLIDDVQR